MLVVRQEYEIHPQVRYVFRRRLCPGASHALVGPVDTVGEGLYSFPYYFQHNSLFLSLDSAEERRENQSHAGLGAQRIGCTNDFGPALRC